MGGGSYNLACCYAVKRDKQNALAILEGCFAKDEIDVVFVREDSDWQPYLEDANFVALLAKYEKP